MLKRQKRLVRSFWPTLRWIQRLCNDPQVTCNYYPDQTRKPRASIIFDNLLWLARYQEANECYYAYGFDVKDRSEHWNYGGHIELRDLRNRLNRRFVRGKDATSYSGLVADKFVWGMYLRSLKFPTPRVHGLASRDSIFYCDTGERLPLESVLAQEGIDTFCKEVLGGCGSGIFTVKVIGGELYLDDQKASIGDFRQRLIGRHVLQERIRQHPKVDELCPSSVNTLRLVTVLQNNQPVPLAGVFRVGVRGAREDNWSAGGLVGGIDLETGRLGKHFLFKPGAGGVTDRHPDTQMLFDGFEIPSVPEAVSLGLDLHRHFYGVHSIGWDIAFTSDGPTFLEANDEWMIQLMQVVHGGMRDRFLKTVPQP
ncbi:MAG: sugar-transfer associated ATP-grasp domain-containing protein [Pirellulaceae bacterium]